MCVLCCLTSGKARRVAPSRSSPRCPGGRAKPSVRSLPATQPVSRRPLNLRRAETCGTTKGYGRPTPMATPVSTTPSGPTRIPDGATLVYTLAWIRPYSRRKPTMTTIRESMNGRFLKKRLALQILAVMRVVVHGEAWNRWNPQYANDTVITMNIAPSSRCLTRHGGAGVARSVALAIIGAAVTAGCGTALSSSAQGPAGSSPPVASGRTSANPQPTAEAACYLLSRQQVQSALGLSVKSPVSTTGECLYDFSNRAGEVNFGISVSSAERARTDFNATESSDTGVSGLTLRHLTGIGQDAFLLVANGAGGQGADVEVLAGNATFGLQIYWADAVNRPGMAVTLAREAITRLHASSLASRG